MSMSKSNGWSISADFGATSASLTIKHTVKHYFSQNKGGALKNNTNTSHISVFSHGENPTEFFCKVCLVPEKTTLKFFVFTILCWGSFTFMICLYITFQIRDLINTNTILTFKHGKPISMGPKTDK